MFSRGFDFSRNSQFCIKFIIQKNIKCKRVLRNQERGLFYKILRNGSYWLITSRGSAGARSSYSIFIPPFSHGIKFVWRTSSTKSVGILAEFSSETSLPGVYCVSFVYLVTPATFRYLLRRASFHNSIFCRMCVFGALETHS